VSCLKEHEKPAAAGRVLRAVEHHTNECWAAGWVGVVKELFLFFFSETPRLAVRRRRHVGCGASFRIWSPQPHFVALVGMAELQLLPLLPPAPLACQMRRLCRCRRLCLRRCSRISTAA
jgi:hypothetical protein